MDGSRDYDLIVRQQPKQARMCGVGGMSCLALLFVFSAIGCLFIFIFNFFVVAIPWGL
jgi:hypothetical protein